MTKRRPVRLLKVPVSVEYWLLHVGTKMSVLYYCSSIIHHVDPLFMPYVNWPCTVHIALWKKVVWGPR